MVGRRQTLGAFVAAVVLAAAGCATLPACPARGGPAWTELTTEHFVVRTDLPDDAAREVIRELEETWAAMLAAVWPDAPGPPDRTQVIALASTSELSSFTGAGIIGGLSVHKSPFPATIVTGAAFESERGTILRHELGHHLSRWFLPQEPLWFSEGIATYLETIRYDRSEQRAVVGEPATDRVLELRGLGLFPASRLLAETYPAMAETRRFESTTWLLVHYLINNRSSAFEALQRRIGTFQPAQDAWAAELGDLDAQRLATTLDQYLSSGSYTVSSVKLPPWNGPAAARAMSDAEVHGIRAYLYAVGQRPRTPTTLENMRFEIAEATSADPTGAIEALAVQSYEVREQTPEQRREVASRVSTAHPEVALAWLMAADADGPGLAQRTALVRALVLAPNDPEVLARLAVVKASARAWDQAVALSRRALRLRAMSPQLLAIHVASLVETGQCREADFYVAALRAPAMASAPVSAAIAGRLPALRARCQEVAVARASSDPDDDDGDADGTAADGSIHRTTPPPAPR